MVTVRLVTTATVVALMAVVTAFAVVNLDVTFRYNRVTAIVAERPADPNRAMPNTRIEIDPAARSQVQDLSELNFWRSWQWSSPVGDDVRFRNYVQIIGPERHHVPERWPLPLPDDP